MARLDEYIFGYAEGKVEKKDASKLSNTLLKLGICSSVSPSGDFTLREKDRARFTSYARAKMRFELSETRGIWGFIRRQKHRYGLFLALICLCVLFILSSDLVWDVRVSGNERLSDYVIEDALRSHGFGVGSSWRRTDKNSVEAALLSENADIAWISVNRRGTVAYVEVIESENIGKEEGGGPLYSNIVADRDGVVEEITVKSGTAAVKAGDVVKKGDILISGVVENESGAYFCRAEGSVRAKGVTDVTSEVSREVTERTVQRQRLAHVRVVLFNFSINIFKNYGNHENTYDIIKEIREFALFDKYRLPIRLEVSYAYEYTESVRTRSEDEMTEVAKRELDGRIYSMFKDADVIKLRTSGEFKDGMFCLTSRVVYSTDIGKESVIEIN